MRSNTALIAALAMVSACVCSGKGRNSSDATQPTDVLSEIVDDNASGAVDGSEIPDTSDVSGLWPDEIESSHDVSGDNHSACEIDRVEPVTAGSACEIDDATHCSTDGEFEEHLSGPTAITSSWICRRPFIVRCTRNRDGSRTWKKESCGNVPNECLGNQVFASCQENARGAFCCPSVLYDGYDATPFYTYGPNLCRNADVGVLGCDENRGILSCAFVDGAVTSYHGRAMFAQCRALGENCLYRFITEECPLVTCPPEVPGGNPVIVSSCSEPGPTTGPKCATVCPL